MPSHPMRFLVVGWILLTCAVCRADATSSEERSCCTDQICSCLTYSQSRGWKIAESKNFRIHYRSTRINIPEIARHCEEHRVAMRLRWLGTAEVTSWTPKCEVYLYSSGSDFQRSTRYPAEGWGFADLEIGDGRVWNRILRMRSDNPQQMMPVLFHELTHVVLADRFVRTSIPCWADEGIAVLSEPPERHRKLHQWLSSEIRRGRKYSLRSLTRLRHFPSNRYQSDLMYAQSGSLVAYLLQEQGLQGHDVLTLVERIEHAGWETAVTERFPQLTSAQLEADWHRWMAQVESSRE